MALKVGELFASLKLDSSQFDSGMSAARSRFSGLGGTLTGMAASIAASIGAAFSVGLVAKTGIGYNALMEQSAIAWETIAGDAKKAQDILKTLEQMGAETPFEFEGLDKASKMLYMAGFQGDKLYSTLRNVGDAVAAVGGNQETLEGVSMALFQMSAKGKVSAEEMNQMAERGLPVWEIMGKAMGKSTQELMKMSEAGELLAKDALPALIDGLGKRFGGAMEKQSKTFNGMMSTMKDNLKMLAGEITKPLFESLKKIMPGVNDMLSGLLDSIKKNGLKDAIMGMFPPEIRATATKIFTGIGDAIGGLKSIIVPILTDMVAFIKQKLAQIKQFWDENGAQFMQAVKNVWSGITAVFKFIAPVILFVVKSLWENVKGVIDGALKVIMGVIKVFAGLFTGDFKKMWEGIKQIFAGALQAIWNGIQLMFVGKLVSGIKTGVTGATNHIKNLWQAGKDFFKRLWDDVVKIVTNMANGVKTYFANMWNNTKTIFSLLRQFGENIFKALWNTVRSVVTNIFHDIKAAFTNALNATKNIFTSMFNAVKNAITNAFNTVKSTATNIFNAIKIHFTEAKDAGQSAFESLRNGISNIIGKVVSVVKSLVGKITGAFSGIKNKMLSIGRDLVAGLINGITEKMSAAVEKVKEMAGKVINAAKKVFDVHSPSRVMMAIGGYVAEGLAVGISNATSGVVRAVKSVVQSTVPEFRGIIQMTQTEMKNFNNIMKRTEQTMRQEINTIRKNAKTEREAITREEHRKIQEIEQTARSAKRRLTEDEERRIKEIHRKAAEERTKVSQKEKNDIARAQKELAAEKLQALTDYINKQRELGKMSLEQEVEYWQEAVKRFKAGTEEKIKAEINFKNAKEALDRETFNKEKEYIEKRKFYNKMSLVEELKAWEQIAARYKKGTEQREEAERNIYTIKKEIHNKIKQLDEEYMNRIKEVNNTLIAEEKRLNDEYKRALEDRTKALYDAFGLFDEMKLNEVTGDQLLSNLEGQVGGFKKWTDDIASLTGRGLDSGLIAELRTMGPKAAGEIAALNQMSNEQLMRYQELWRTKSAMARQLATAEMESLRIETQQKVEQLRAQTATQLEVIKAEWVQKIAEIRYGTQDELSTMDQVGRNSMQKLLEGMDSMSEPLVQKARSIAQAIQAEIKAALDAMSSAQSKIGAISGATKAVLTDNVSKASAPSVITSKTATSSISNSKAPTVVPVSSGPITVNVKADDLKKASDVVRLFEDIRKSSRSK